MVTRRLPFQLLLHRGVGESATPFPEFRYFTLDPYLIELSTKQSDIKYYFWVFGMIQPGIETRSLGPLANVLFIRSMTRNKKTHLFFANW